MFLEERQDIILSMLARDGKVRVRDLSEKFKVTEDCIRKDLGALEKKGKLKRTYGGAVRIRENSHMVEVSKHRNTDVEAKQRIAQAAVKLIHEKDMVFLDISMSNLAIAELLVKMELEVTVVTNMIDILVVLARNPKIRVVFAGGKINKSRDGFWGGMTLDFISRLKPDIAFVGAVGVDVKENSVSISMMASTRQPSTATARRHTSSQRRASSARTATTTTRRSTRSRVSSPIRSRRRTSALRRIRTAWRSSCHDDLYARMAVTVELENSIYGHPGRTEGICVLPRSPFPFSGVFHRLDGSVHGPGHRGS